jgi:hypothetical protein
MKRKVMVLFLLAGSSMFAGTRFVVGFGVPAPVPVVTYAAPAPVAYAPAAYYYGPRYVVRPHYWARPYAGVWVGPRWFGGHYYRGYWRR